MRNRGGQKKVSTMCWERKRRRWHKLFIVFLFSLISASFPIGDFYANSDESDLYGRDGEDSENVVDWYVSLNYTSPYRPDYHYSFNALARSTAKCGLVIRTLPDFNGDGYLDVYALEGKNSILLFYGGNGGGLLRNLTSAEADVNIQFNENSTIVFVAPGKLDNDNCDDIFVAVREGGSLLGYTLYINESWRGDHHVSNVSGKNVYGCEAAQIVDVNLDGKTELLLECRDTVYIYRHTTLDTVSALNESTADAILRSCNLPIWSAHVTGAAEGNLVIPAHTYWGEVSGRVYVTRKIDLSEKEVNLTAILLTTIFTPGGPDPPPAPVGPTITADVTGDGYDDIIMSGDPFYDSPVYMIFGRSSLPRTILLSRGEYDGIANGKMPMVGDIDNDGIQELYLYAPDYNTATVRGAIKGYEIGDPPYDYRYALHYALFVAGSIQFPNPVILFTGDIDGDGLKDLMIRSGPPYHTHLVLGATPTIAPKIKKAAVNPSRVYRGETFHLTLWVMDEYCPIFSIKIDSLEWDWGEGWRTIKDYRVRVNWDYNNVTNSTLDVLITVDLAVHPGFTDLRIMVVNTHNLSSDWYYMNGSLEVLDYDPVVYDFEIYPERLYVWEDITISGQVWDRDDGLGNLSISLEIWNGSYGLGGRWEEVDGFEYEIRDEYGSFEGLWKPERYGVGRHVLRLKVEDSWGGVCYSGNRSYYGEALPPEVRVGSGRYEVYRGDELRVPVEVVHEYLEVEVRVWIRNGSEVVEGGWDEVVEEAIVEVPLNVSAGVYDLVVEVYSEMGNVSEEVEGIVEVLNNLPVMDIPEKLRFEIGRERYELSGRGWDREDGYNVSWEVEVLSGPLRVVEEGEGYVEFESEEIGAGKILFRVMDRDGGLYEREVNYTVMPEGVGGVGYNLTVLVKGVGGEAVGGARVVLVGGGVRLDKVCGGDGVVVFEGLSEGWYEVRVYPPEGSGYRDWEGREYVDGDKILEVNLEVEGVVGGGGVIRGMVVSGGEPIEGVRVVLIGPVEGENRTGEDGVFRFEGLPAGNYTVRFEMEGYRGVEVKVVLEEGEEKNLGMIEMEREGEVGVSRGVEEWVWKAILLAVVIMAALTVFYFRRRGLSGMEE